MALVPNSKPGMGIDVAVASGELLPGDGPVVDDARVGVDVESAVGIEVAVCVGGVGRGEAVEDAVFDGVDDGVSVGVGEGVSVGVGVGVLDGVGDGVWGFWTSMFPFMVLGWMEHRYEVICSVAVNVVVTAAPFWLAVSVSTRMSSALLTAPWVIWKSWVTPSAFTHVNS